MHHLFLIGGSDTVAADSPEQAAECWFGETGETSVDYPDLDIERIPGDQDIKVWFDYDPKGSSYDAPRTARYTKDDDYWYITATAAMWAKGAKYPEIICSTEF